MSISLRICPGCARHVRADEARCPFCAVALDAQPRAHVHEAPSHRARAALIAGALTLAACNSGPSNSYDPSTAGAYGGPPSSGSTEAPASSDAAASEEASAPTVIAIYGAPPAKDER